MFKKIVLCLCIAALSILMWSCDFLNPCQEKEILRKTSQDNFVDYVVIEKGCGATASTNTIVYIVPKGRSVDKFHPVFIADHVDGLEVIWLESKQMLIAYAEARIFKYKNFWHSRHIENWNYIVSIKEYQK